MNKFLVFGFAFLMLLTLPIEAQWYRWGQKYCWGCRRYMDPSLAEYDGLYFGYVDNINYPQTYALPRNYYFNYCLPCRESDNNYRYFQNCLRYSMQK
jgi:hypothetical protein